jgi:thiamine transport system ATP-binding protein
MSIQLNKIYKKIDDFTLDISLDIEKGELISLLGPSGCGKTTTLRIIAGFEDPERGSLLIDQKEIGHLVPEKRNIGMVFQDYALFPHMTVYENIAYGPKLRKWSKEKIDESVQRFLNLVHLKGFAQRKIAHLSGGEQQRVALARALVTEPRLLLLDEPLSALDAKLRKNLRREIRRIQQELQITTIYVTHDQEEALAISDRIAVMNHGRCIQFDNPKTLYREPSQIFSAGFIGNSNIVKVLDINHKDKNIITEIGIFNVDYISSETYKSPFLFFRPESFLPVDDLKKGNIIKGIIIGEEYSGTHISIDIQCRDSVIKALIDENENWKRGDEISLYLPPAKCRVLY